MLIYNYIKVLSLILLYCLPLIYSQCLPLNERKNLNSQLPIKITTSSLNTQNLGANLVKILIEEQFGIPVTLVNINDTLQPLDLLLNNQADLNLEVNSNVIFNSLIKTSPLGYSKRTGWYIPSYMVEHDKSLLYWKTWKTLNLMNKIPLYTGNPSQESTIYSSKMIKTLWLNKSIEINTSFDDQEFIDKIQDAVELTQDFLIVINNPDPLFEIYSDYFIRMVLPENFCQCPTDTCYITQTCDFSVNNLNKAFSQRFLSTIDDPVKSFLFSFSLNKDNINDLLTNYLNKSTSYYNSSCKWILDNPSVWKTWIYTNTTCTNCIDNSNNVMTIVFVVVSLIFSTVILFIALKLYSWIIKRKQIRLMISYSHNDIEFATKIKNELINNYGNKYHIWIDKQINSGEDWRTNIAEAIEKCHAVIFICSPDAVSSRYCKDEIYYAKNQGKHIFPILHKDCWKSLKGGLKMILQRIQWTDFIKNDFRNGLQLLDINLKKKCCKMNKSDTRELELIVVKESTPSLESVVPQSSPSFFPSPNKMPKIKHIRRNSVNHSDVYISYDKSSSNDRCFSLLIKEFLQARHISIGNYNEEFLNNIEEDLVLPFNSNDKETEKEDEDVFEISSIEIDKCSIIIYIVSKSSIKSPLCIDEIHYAYENKKPIIKICIEDIRDNNFRGTMGIMLQNMPSIDFFNYLPKTNIDNQYMFTKLLMYIYNAKCQHIDNKVNLNEQISPLFVQRSLIKT
jgi:ABC-type proline/glycine betaine transport system substrate-binding protein